LRRFNKKLARQRASNVSGSTDRKTLIAVLARNTAFVKQMRVQPRPYQSSLTQHHVWLRFRGYTPKSSCWVGPRATPKPRSPPKPPQKRKALPAMTH
jgi:hypothetical protein